jgi:NAD(P)-dependent dehydrogenase (short-subunit alcohol dehydrogenase family)
MATRFQGQVAVVTGAAQGIGAALSLELARRGCNLALADIDLAALAGTAQKARERGVSVSEHRLDVSDRAAVARFPLTVLDAHPRVNLLFNNAGVAMMGTFEQLSVEEFEWLLGINLFGVVRMTKAFLPILKRQEQAHIVNISSVFGFISPAGQSAYCTSKFAVRGLTEVLQHELEDTSISVSCVHPGGIRTGIAAHARCAAAVDPALKAGSVALFDSLARTTPEQAAMRILDGVERGEKRIVVGGDAHLFDWLQRLLPVGYWGVLKRIVRRSQQVPA